MGFFGSGKDRKSSRIVAQSSVPTSKRSTKALSSNQTNYSAGSGTSAATTRRTNSGTKSNDVESASPGTTIIHSSTATGTANTGAAASNTAETTSVPMGGSQTTQPSGSNDSNTNQSKTSGIRPTDTVDTGDEGISIENTYTEDTEGGADSRGAATFDNETIQGQGPIPNPEALVMASLISWKAASEEGPWFVRFIMVMSSLGMIVTSIVPFCLDIDALTFHHGILAAYVIIASVVEVILDGRLGFLRNPVGMRAKLRNLITKNFNLLRFLWGRGLMATFAGALHMSQMWLMSLISGGIMVLVGIAALWVGWSSSANLEALKSSLTDDDFLWYQFQKYDNDNDGCQEPHEFAHFLLEIGIEFDDLYTLKLFNSIPKQYDKKVSFEEFQRWWSQCKFADNDGYTNPKFLLKL